jgi:hypothetical protein
MTDKTEAMDNLIVQDADLIEICPDDLVQRLKGHSEIMERDKGKFVRFIDVATCTEAADRIEAQAAEIERLHRALRRYGRHLIGENPCDLYANSTRSCTCGLTDDLKWS